MQSRSSVLQEDVLYFKHTLLDLTVLTGKNYSLCCRSEVVKSSGLCYVEYYDR